MKNFKYLLILPVLAFFPVSTYAQTKCPPCVGYALVAAAGAVAGYAAVSAVKN